MKKSAAFVVILMACWLIVLPGCSVVYQAKAFDRFVNSRFSLETVTFQKVGGVDVTQGKKLDLGEVMQITRQLFQKKLSAQVLLTIQVHNLYPKKAEVNGMDWIMEKDGKEIARGQMSKPVEVAGYQKDTFALPATFDVSEVLQSQNIQQIISFVTSPEGEKKFQTLGLKFKVKPWYKLAGDIHKFPGYITIRPAS